jgi:glycosyltransferase involved in cell wall biosynthesis
MGNPDAMKVMFISARGDAFGGASLHVADMSRRLTDDGHSVRILVGGTPNMEVPRRFAEKGLDFVCIDSMGRSLNPWKDFRAWRAIRKEIREFSPDLISTHASKGGALGRLACIGSGIPVLYTPHCWSFVDGFPKARFYRFVEGVLAKRTSKIIAVCDDERQFGLGKGVGREDQTISIHNGVIDVAGAVAERSKASDQTVRLLMVGRFENQKDQQLLLQALAEIADLPWEVTFVGDGPNKEACVELTKTLGIEKRVEFAGYSDQVERYFSTSDIFALVSNWEGFPRSILEAMRAGLPVITSDVGGSREAVIDGETGRVVKKATLPELTDALRDLVADSALRTKMGKRGRDVYLERFTFERMYEQYCQLYRSLLR